MSVKARLQRLERRAHLVLPPAPEGEPLEEDWLPLFEKWGHEQGFAREPDLPVALACYRQALAEAARGDPPFDPPPSFRPELRAKQRTAVWRRPHHYRSVDAAFQWLAEMYRRVIQGIPPVTETEFAELAVWFHANEERLHRQSLPSQLLDLGEGRRTTLADLRWGIHQGPRVLGAGQLAEDLRRLRQHYGVSVTD